MCVGVFLFTCEEGYEFYSDGWKEYIGDFWNKYDLVNLVLFYRNVSRWSM